MILPGDPSRMVCPKCGVEQPAAVECVNCQIVVARFRSSRRGMLPQAFGVWTLGAFGAVALAGFGAGLVWYGFVREVPRPEHTDPVPTLVTPADVAPAPPPGVLDTYWSTGAAGFRRAVQSQIDLKVPMVVYFHRRECPECEAIQKNLLTSPEFSAWIQDSLRVEVTVDATPDDAALATKFSVTDTPAVVAVRTNGQRVPIPVFSAGTRTLVTSAAFVDNLKKATGR